LAHLVGRGEALGTPISFFEAVSFPASIDKFDDDSDPKIWLRTYSITVQATNSNNDNMAAYFPMMMS
jgi:hypothetical protein